MSDDSKLDEILQRLRETEQELAQEMERKLDEQRERFHYKLKDGKVKFEAQISALQQRYRVGTWRYLKEAKLRYILSAPIIYSMVVPLALLDLSLTVYQQICFRVYRIPRVKRSEYFVIDRHLLSYLNVIEKVNCVYCGYGNGVIAYGREITARTEQFWCPIKHAQRPPGSHARTDRFFEYGDASAWREELKNKRREWDDC